MKPNAFDTDSDVIDSRDVIARIAELEGERDGYDGVEGWAEDYPEEAAELAALVALQEEAEGYAEDWTHGVTLIRESYFEDYARELAEDIGAIAKDAQWPACHIDWDAACDALKMDYTEVDFDGVSYWVR